MSTLTQFLGGRPRRQIVTLTASNASLPVPLFAQGGRGIVRVSGCGAGASGGVSVTTSTRGGGGGAGGYCIDLSLLIPSGTTTLNAAIGAAGAGVSAGSAVSGNAGGNTSLTVGTIALLLQGGQAGASNAGGNGGIAVIGDITGVNRAVNAAPYSDPAGLAGLRGTPSRLSPGATAGDGNSAAMGFGVGAFGLFGQPGAGLSVAPTVNTNGLSAAGYGTGGTGALWVSGGNVTSGAGAPGILILEFVEGV